MPTTICFTVLELGAAISFSAFSAQLRTSSLSFNLRELPWLSHSVKISISDSRKGGFFVGDLLLRCVRGRIDPVNQFRSKSWVASIVEVILWTNADQTAFSAQKKLQRIANADSGIFKNATSCYDRTYRHGRLCFRAIFTQNFLEYNARMRTFKIVLVFCDAFNYFFIF